MKRIARKWIVIVAALGALVAVIGGAKVIHDAVAQNNASQYTCSGCLTVTGPTTSPTLYPGAAPSSVPITFANSTSEPIYVTQLQVSFTNTWQTGCSPSEFQFSNRSFSSGGTTTIVYPTRLAVPPYESIVDNETLALADNNSNQNACHGQGLALSYQGTAQYTVPTTAALTYQVNAGADTDTLTATVSANIEPSTAGQPPQNGDGNVTFYQCSSTSTSSCTALGSSPFSSPGVATWTIPASSVGTYQFEAIYTVPSGDTDFTGSSSGIVTEDLSGCVAVPTKAASQIFASGYTYNGNYEVKSGSSLWLDGGTINGNVTVDAGGQFAATGGTITGNLQSSGGPVAMSGTTVKGNVQTQNAGLSLGPATSIGGNAQAQGGGPLCSDGNPGVSGTNGAPAQPVNVKGNLQGQSLTSSTPSSINATIVGNNLQWQSNSSPVTIGTAGANTVLGNLQVQTNSGQVTVGASGSATSTSGNIIVQSNTGGGTLTGNSAGGNCLLSGDKPGVVGAQNTAKGANNQCNTGTGGA